MKFRLSLLAAIFLSAFVAVACNKSDRTLKPNTDPTDNPSGDDSGTDSYASPGKPAFNVVAHRGGSSECNYPDNSIAALQYAMSLKCYASECDIYWTSDDNVVVAHADSYGKINGFYPWEHTAAEIRGASKLTNGETIPTLSEYIDQVMKSGSCTKLWLDIKLTQTSDKTYPEYAINATKKACEIITDKKAKNFCEFICTGNATVWASALVYAKKAECNIGWMANKAPDSHKTAGSTWANMCAAAYMTPYGNKYTVDQFVGAGMQVSVFNVDKKSGDSNAVYSDSDVQYYVQNYSKMKAICTNYPSWLMSKLQ